MFPKLLKGNMDKLQEGFLELLRNINFWKKKQ